MNTDAAAPPSSGIRVWYAVSISATSVCPGWNTVAARAIIAMFTSPAKPSAITTSRLE